MHACAITRTQKYSNSVVHPRKAGTVMPHTRLSKLCTLTGLVVGLGPEYFVYLDTAGYSISYNDFLISLNLSRLLEESDHTPIFAVPYAVPPARESLTADGIDLKRNAIVVCVI